MRKVSIAIYSVFNERYLPLVKHLDKEGSLSYAYGRGYPRNYKYTDEPLNKMQLTKIPDRFALYIVKPITKLLRIPQYYTYWIKMRIFDRMCKRKIKNDSSEIVITNPLLINTVIAAKKRGKIVVLEAGNSEPVREHRLVSREYEKFNIRKKFIYGNPIYKDTCKKSLDLADYIITISDVSRKTYINAGYGDKCHLVPLNASSFPCQNEVVEGRKKVFISTAQHSFIKGTHRLLLAWEKSQIQDIPLLIVGSVQSDLQEFIDKYGPFHNVQFIGYRSDLQEWYKQFDAVGVLLSLSEGAVRVTPEMMSFGFPLIVSNDATCDLIQDKYNGLIVETTNEESIIEKLRWFADDWSRVNSMRENVFKSIRNRNITNYADDVFSFIHKIQLKENK